MRVNGYPRWIEDDTGRVQVTQDRAAAERWARYFYNTLPGAPEITVEQHTEETADE